MEIAPYLSRSDQTTIGLELLAVNDASVEIAPYLSRSDEATIGLELLAVNDASVEIAPYLSRSDEATIGLKLLAVNDASVEIAPDISLHDGNDGLMIRIHTEQKLIARPTQIARLSFGRPGAVFNVLRVGTAVVVVVVVVVIVVFVGAVSTPFGNGAVG